MAEKHFTGLINFVDISYAPLQHKLLLDYFYNLFVYSIRQKSCKMFTYSLL